MYFFHVQCMFMAVVQKEAETYAVGITEIWCEVVLKKLYWHKRASSTREGGVSAKREGGERKSFWKQSK